MHNKYIGIPYQENGRDENGIDCWGLVLLFYKQEFNIELPNLDSEYISSYDSHVPQLVNNYKKDNWTKTNTPKLGDICLFNILGEPTHVGIYLENSKFLHAREGHSSVIESIKKPVWNTRLEGIYTYTPQSNIIQLTGSPHPFKTNKIIDFATAGLTLKQCVDYVCEKYKVSERLLKQIVVAVDGVVVSKENWTTTILRSGQLVTYKTIPQGRNALRVFLFIAIVLILQEPTIAAKISGAVAGATGLTGTSLYFATAAAKIAIAAAGFALVNALVPIRMPGLNTSDLTTGNQLNLFSGTSNRANPYGSIPVVLGRVRMTPLLGAQAYVDTQITTSYLHMQLVWGFGPLDLDISELYIGANKLDYYYQERTGSVVPQPVTVYGYTDDNGNEIETNAIQSFNKLYPNIVEQQYKNVELVNDAGVNNEEIVTFQETEATKVTAIISFPEGLRTISTSNGSSQRTGVSFTVDLERIVEGVAQPIPNWSSADAYTGLLISPAVTIQEYSPNEGYYWITRSLYQKIAYCITEKNGIQVIKGIPSPVQGNPTTSYINTAIKQTSFASLIPPTDNNKYLFEPQIPNGYKVLFTLVVYQNSIVENTNLVQTTHNYSGWIFTQTQLTGTVYDPDYGNQYNQPLERWNIAITAGTLGLPISGQPVAGSNGTIPTPINVWSTINLVTTTPSISARTNNGKWMGQNTPTNNSFMNYYAVWIDTNPDNFDRTATVQFPYDGFYTIEAAVDGYNAYINFGGDPIVGLSVPEITIPSYSYIQGLRGPEAPYKTVINLKSGTGTIRVRASNINTATPGIAVRITYVLDNSRNFALGTNHITIGDNEFANYKDGFNYPIVWNNLSPGQYRVKIRRVTSSNPDYQGGYKASFRSQFLSASAFKIGNPIVPPKGVGLCRTAIVVESSSRVNGSVDGVNAIVQTRGWDYWPNVMTGSARRWTPDKLINNPASLFVYVLTHPANAYKVDPINPWNSIDIETITYWHTYCRTELRNQSNVLIRPQLTYNGIVTNTTSVLSLLQDICAAGMASPVYIDGKWSVVIDEPKPHIIQHFTPHNSWGFEAVKNLPKLPDAFRVNFPDETNAFQNREILVANFGKTISDAKIIEELNLPGITRVEQARYFARWHFAQLQYRPEIFTINTDFEYLVCTRGDRVKATHDIPQWGLASGRIKSISSNKLTLTLTEDVALVAGTLYQIRIRTDNLSTTIGSGSIERSLATIVTTGTYNTITLSTAVDNTVKVDDLFMLGELNKITQDLIVQSIEPTSNTSAKITLVAYNESLYTFEFRPDQDNTPYLPSYAPLITKRIASDIVKNTIVGSPTISNIRSGDQLSEEIATGSYQNVVIISWQNPIDLPVIAEKVEFQIIQSTEIFNDTKQSGVYLVNKDAASYTAIGLTSNMIYKIRARYRNSEGTISGPWGAESVHTVEGKTINYYNAPSLILDLQRTAIVAKPTAAEFVPSNFSHYEFRLIKDVNNNITTDFWDLAGTYTFTGIEQGSIDLKNVSLPRISSAGITYRVACRAVDKTNNYSSSSVIASIVVQTIK